MGWRPLGCRLLGWRSLGQQLLGWRPLGQHYLGWCSLGCRVLGWRSLGQHLLGRCALGVGRLGERRNLELTAWWLGTGPAGPVRHLRTPRGTWQEDIRADPPPGWGRPSLPGDRSNSGVEGIAHRGHSTNIVNDARRSGVRCSASGTAAAPVSSARLVCTASIGHALAARSGTGSATALRAAASPPRPCGYSSHTAGPVWPPTRRGARRGRQRCESAARRATWRFARRSPGARPTLGRRRRAGVDLRSAGQQAGLAAST